MVGAKCWSDVEKAEGKTRRVRTALFPPRPLEGDPASTTTHSLPRPASVAAEVFRRL